MANRHLSIRRTCIASKGHERNRGTAQLAGSLLLANNNFYRQFTDDPAPTPAAQALPQRQGSGAVRDLSQELRA